MKSTTSTNRPAPDDLRRRLRALLGIAERDRVFVVRERAALPAEGFALERIMFQNQDGAVPALLSRPLSRRAAGPAVLYIHAHGNRYDIGKSELIDGRPALRRPWAAELARAGITALAIDLPCFGERAGTPENALAKALLWRGRTLFGEMLLDLEAASTWLAAEPGVDPARIGTLGISMGSTLGWWLGALDQRIAAVAELCCLADLEALIEAGTHDLHGLYMTVPGLLAVASTAEIAALIAPRPHLSCVGTADPLTPPEGIARVDRHLRAVYAAAGAPENWELHAEDGVGHQETEAMRARVHAFLARTLGR